jgi:shikimate kinase
MEQGWFFFGQIGAGKSSLGAAAARAWGIPFHEGDEDLPPSAIAAIISSRFVSDLEPGIVSSACTGTSVVGAA